MQWEKKYINLRVSKKITTDTETVIENIKITQNTQFSIEYSNQN